MPTFHPLHASELSEDSDPLSHLPQTRYLLGRPSTASSNPRGKYHRKPLSWKRSKLCTADGYEEDARLYREWLWQKDKSSKRSDGRLAQNNNLEDESDDDAPRKGKYDKKRRPKQRPRNLHLLKLVDAHAKRHRRVAYRCGCCWELSRSDRVQYWRRNWEGVMCDGRDVAEMERFPFPGEMVNFEWIGEGDEDVLRMEDVTVRGVEFVLRHKGGRDERWMSAEAVEDEDDNVEEIEEKKEDISDEESPEEADWEFVWRCQDHVRPPSVGDASEWFVVGVRSECWEDISNVSEESSWS